MKKKFLFFIILFMLSFLYIKDTYAYDKSTYASRALCGNYEVALFKADGTIEQKSCHTNYDEANAAMVADGNKDLVVLGKWDGVTKIFNANAALVDLTGISGTFNIYNSYQINTEHTYMVGESGYGGVDAALLAISYSSYANTFTAQMKINGYSGWVRLGIIEIVPLVWVQSSNSYTVTGTNENDGTIRHNYVTKIQNTYLGSSGNTIGPKPTMLEAGTYYSYDGHYFYKDRYTMIADYKAGTYANSVNPEKPYYNYYQFLPQHTKTTYSSINIDEYIRNVMGYNRDVFGSKASANTSRLYGKGAFFYNAQELYGGNALLALGVSRNESANGRSNLSINKNNGFGLNAVDSNPTQAANWFATFSQSIYDYNNSWVTYGYSEPTDYRYFGAQNGNKYVGMNVKYASDVYWGEKMASNYFSLDKAYGLQDYNYYQTAVTKHAAPAKASPNTSSKTVFNYPSSDVGLVLLEEVEGEEVNGNKIWYKVVSDMNIDTNFNQLYSGYYNWNSYVYIPAAYVQKTNEGKNGYISPNDVPKHQDSGYTYDLHIIDATLKPKVAVSVKDTSYYYDATLTSKTGQTLLNDRYVMAFATAYNEEKEIVAYLVTSDYKYDQKHWVSADSIKFVTATYGQASVTVPDQNVYTIVTPTTIDKLDGHISGLYHYAYTPIFEEKTVDGLLWYRVPVNLSGSSNIYGWTLASAENVLITKYQYTADNSAPVITAKDVTLLQGKEFKELEGVTATDAEDGNLTESIKVTSNNVKTDTPGTYQVTYQVTDKGNVSTYKTITVTIIKDEEPVINASNKVIFIGDEFDPKEGVTATDKEDGPITDITVDDSKVNYEEVGEYEITYTVKDSFGHVVTKTITLTIDSEDEEEQTESEGTFYFDYLDNKDNQLMLRGYLTINGMDNTLNEEIDYYIGYVDTTNIENIYIQEATRITDLTGINRPIYSVDGHKYTHAWFEVAIDVDNLPVGNYSMVVVAESEKTYSTALVTNKLYKTEITGFKTTEKSVNIKNNYSDRTSAVTLYVRDKETPIKNVGSYYNQYDVWRVFEFLDNKLHLKGASYSYGMNLAKDQTVSRTLIFENKDTFETYKYDIGSITNGLYTVALPETDNLDKTRAWYDATIDITKLPKGKYKLYMTTTSNVTDYSEFTDNLGRDLSQKKITIDDKTYQFNLNQEEGNSIELEVS